MNLTTKFDLGQTVFGVRQTTEETRIPCAFCGASGRIAGANGESRACPECHGRGSERAWLPQAWRVVGEFTVGQVRLKVTDSPGIADDVVFDNYSAQSGREESYMLVETGVGTGSVWYVRDLFRSRTEAKTACDERNKRDAVATPQKQLR